MPTFFNPSRDGSMHNAANHAPGWTSSGWESRAAREWSRLLGSCKLYEACPIPGVDGLVVNIDGYSVEESLLPGLSWSVWGWRSLTACIGDLYAVGAEPVAAGFSLGLREDNMAWEAFQGFLAAARYYGVEPLKNDSNSPGRGRGWIDVYCIGKITPPDKHPIPNQAIPGEYAVVQLGYTGYGLLEKRLLEGKGIPLRLMPLLKRKLPTRLPQVLGACRVAAARDNSDGYLHTLQLLATSSRVDIMLSEPPLGDPRLPPKYGGGWALLESWEDYNLLLLVERGGESCLVESAVGLDVPVRVLGYAVPGSGRVVLADGLNELKDDNSFD